MGQAGAALPAADADALAREFALRVVTLAAPEELPFFDEAVREGQRRSGRRRRAHDEPLGFGLDLSLLTPYVLSIAPMVIAFLGEVARGTAADLVKDSLADWIRGHFRGEPAAEVTPLTREQAQRVREAARSKAVELGLAAGQASVLADAVVGAVTVGD
jgi:hypothetical protein